MIGTPIAFGLTMIVCFTLFYYYWRIRQLRARLVAAQDTPAPEDFPVEFGIGKNVVETFPTIKACELKCTATEDLQCPICLVEYEDWEVLRQLPFCHHIFHTLCVGAWFEKQTTCPVCRMSMSKLTESFGDLLAAENMHRGSLPSNSGVTLEVISDNNAPSWMMRNRRVPLPAPPAPALLTTEISTLTCTCPSPEMFLKDTELTKTVTEGDALQGRGVGDFHVVSMIPQLEDRSWHTCSTCKRSTKPVIKFLPSEDSTAIPETHQQSVIQILVQIQAESIQTKTSRASDDEGESLNSQETLGSQETSGSNESIVVEITGGAVANSRSCASHTDNDYWRNSGDVQTVAEFSRGSFEFQPVLTADSGMTNL